MPPATCSFIPLPRAPGALGYARASGIPFEFGLIRSHYIGRTFIEPYQAIRDFGAKIKYNPIRSVLKGKRVIVVDDSIVRGTTSRKIIRMIRNAGAAEVHLRISCPPWRFPCCFGIDTPTRGELIGARHTVEETRQHVEADSLAYLSLEGLAAAVPKEAGPYCDACFTGNYPVKPCEQDTTKVQTCSLDTDEGTLARHYRADKGIWLNEKN